jgi:translation initiation factor IF-2
MTETTGTIRISKVVKEIGVGISTIVEHLSSKGFKIDSNPNGKITEEQYQILLNDFQSDKKTLEDAKQLTTSKQKAPKKEEVLLVPEVKPKVVRNKDEEEEDSILIKSGLVPENAAKTEPTTAKPEKVEPLEEELPKAEEEKKTGLKVMGKIDLDAGKKSKKTTEKPTVKKEEPKKEIKTEIKIEEPKEEIATPTEPTIVTPETEKTDEVTTPIAEVVEPQMKEPNYEKLSGLKVMGKIVLPTEQLGFKKPKPVASSDESQAKKKRKRKSNIVSGSENAEKAKPDPNQVRRDPKQRFDNNKPRYGKSKEPEVKSEITEKEIQDKLKETLARLNPGSKQPNIGAVRSKIRKQKRDAAADKREEAAMEDELSQKVLKVTEYVTANELANLMNVQVTQIISACMTLGMMVSINQRLDAETITIVADEFGYTVEFTTADEVADIEEVEDRPEDLLPRPPIVTVMGHVDHGKTSLLDYVRKANVIAGEAGGITQHIGAYEVTLASGKKVTFLDTPGHEAFTAMRARGAKITDIVIIVIAADDSVMPQTREAISHAQAAGVPIVFAINKIDRDGANPDKIREQLAGMNILVEEWGGKYQCQEISAKKGQNIDALLDKVLLEAEMLDLKANPNKLAVGSVIEATLDKGRGITATVMVQAGTMRVGEPLLAGVHSGRVRAMFDERGKKITSAGPSTPVVLLGLEGAPQAGDKLFVTKTEQEAKEIANKRTQLLREQGIRTRKHITLDEIGRRLAIGNFKELKVIVKGDVDGSVEALSDSLIKLSTEEVQVSVIYKGVGQISESDVLLASASDAIIIGFQVRPSAQARKLAENESIDIRLYSIIYKAIEEIKAAIEGMLEPTTEEKITGNVEIREVFKISKVGTVAGCMVTDGKIFRNNKIRLIRDGVVIFSGELSSLKRFKDDVKEVASGYDCGITIANYNDIKEGDQIESYEIVETKRKLK